jgi:glycosyltransferase involved in cell wall biosynthesis
MQSFCFITTCRSRLEHLRQALPTFADQPGTECVVVDYDCPQDTAGWVAANHPNVTVVRQKNKPRFETSRARNLGAGATRAKWLCFIDADTLLAPDFSRVVLPMLRPDHYYRPFPHGHEATGFVICHRDHFVQMEGYDAAIQGYGMEDYDLYARLDEVGAKRARFPGELIKMISHGHELRTENFDIKNVALSVPINEIYCALKWDLMRMRRGNVPLADRIQLHASITKTVHDAHRLNKPVDFRVPVALRQARGMGKLDVGLQYRTQLPLVAKEWAAPAVAAAIHPATAPRPAQAKGVR